MKLRKTIKGILVGGACVLPMAAFAVGEKQGLQGNFNNWTMDSNGVITTDAGVNKTAQPITDAGFIQETVEIGGKTFIHTVMADTTNIAGSGTLSPTNNADLEVMGLADENYVMLGSGTSNGGIADLQQARQKIGASAPAAPDDGYFDQRVELNTGSAFMNMNCIDSTCANPMVKISQDVWNETTGGDGTVGTADDSFNNTFDFVHGMDMMTADGGSGVGKWAQIDVGQFVDLSAEGTTGSQTFTFAAVENSYEDGTISLGGTVVGTVNLGDSADSVDIDQSLSGLGEFGFNDVAIDNGGDGTIDASADGFSLVSKTSPGISFSDSGDADGKYDPFQ